MYPKIRLVILVSLFMLLGLSTAFGQGWEFDCDGNNSFSWQSLLTDSIGNPLPAGNYLLGYCYYEDSAATMLIFCCSTIITVDAGKSLAPGAVPGARFFSTSLAYPVPINEDVVKGRSMPPQAFPELWIKITLEGETIEPTLKINSVPFASVAQRVSGDIVTQPGKILVIPPAPFDDSSRIVLSADASGGELDLKDASGASTINLHGGQTGNTSVEFPTDAIDASEMLNEPGIAHSFIFSGIAALALADSLVDSLVISIPTSGYLYVSATGWFQVDHVQGSGDKTGRAWVDDAKPINFNNFTIWSLASSYGSDIVYGPFAITYIQQVSAGQKVIYLMADQVTGTGMGIRRTHLTAQFFPTAYGAVEATRIATTDQNGSASESGVELVPAEIYDASLMVIKELEAEREALRAENERLRLKKE